MATIKLLHVTCIFIWIGNLLMLSRFMGYHVKEDPATQVRLAALYRRMYNFVGLPTMVLSIFFGMILLTQLDLSYKPGWFHMKMTFLLAMIALDMVCGHFVRKLNEGPDVSRGVRYKIFHGLTGLTLIAVLASIYVVRDKEGEWIHRKDKEISWQKTK